jgi:2-polyprenyl-6-methoxyphenol hydroxylase-like FAD-dependent oxidoreductase
VDRLERWSRPGLLCIGDSAHAMSPIGGVGINLAIQDAVAAANLLARPLLQDNVTEDILRKVQERREFPTRMTQRFQVFGHEHAIGPALAERAPIRLIPRPPRIRVFDKHHPDAVLVLLAPRIEMHHGSA